MSYCVYGVQIVETAEEIAGFDKLSSSAQKRMRERVQEAVKARAEYLEEMLQMGVIPEGLTDEEYESCQQRLVDLGFEE